MMITLTGRYGRALLMCGLLALAGCGRGYYPVHGTVSLEDGKPLDKGMVVFESADGTQMARGAIRPDGSYQLSTARPGDGVKPGRYRVLVNPMDLSDVPDEQKVLPFDVKYTRLATSGLEVEVKAEDNDLPIKLTRPARRR
jgi:hypothetical protein